jgi:small subunit ribosomal protein S20
MANHFSALKRARQTERRTEQNRANTSRFRTSLRKFRAALKAGDQKAAQQEFRGTIAAIDKAAAKGVIHRNTASRYKWRLTARMGAIGK